MKRRLTPIFWCPVIRTIGPSFPLYPKHTFSEDLKQRAIFREISTYLAQAVQLNLNTMLDEALRATRVTMTPAERKQYYDRHLRNLQMIVSEDGEVSLSLKVK